MAIQTPDRPQGNAYQQIAQLWEYLYKLAEQLQMMEETINKEGEK